MPTLQDLLNFLKTIGHSWTTTVSPDTADPSATASPDTADPSATASPAEILLWIDRNGYRSDLENYLEDQQ